MAKQQKAYKTKTRIFPKAGFIMLIRILADGTASKKPSDMYTSDASIVQSVTTKYAISSEKMEDGNSFFHAAEHATGVEATADVVFNTYDPMLWEFVAGAETTTTENDYYIDSAEEYVISTDGTVKINASELKADGIVLARTADGSDFEIGTDFTVDHKTATLTFKNTTVAGTAIYVTCEKKSPIVTTSSIPAIPKMQSFKMILIGENCDKEETDSVADNFIISRVKVSGDIPQPPRQKNYASVTYSFGIGKPGVGEKAIDWKSAVKSERTAASTDNKEDITVDDTPTEETSDATLASLSIGSLTLSPAFDAETTEYTAATSNATNTITATATDENATVEITVNGDTVASGGSATWNEGDNEVVVTVVTDTATKAYTVTVTKSTT